MAPMSLGLMPWRLVSMRLGRWVVRSLACELWSSNSNPLFFFCHISLFLAFLLHSHSSFFIHHHHFESISGSLFISTFRTPLDSLD
jgi:hypothetical protein